MLAHAQAIDRLRQRSSIPVNIVTCSAVPSVIEHKSVYIKNNALNKIGRNLHGFKLSLIKWLTKNRLSHYMKTRCDRYFLQSDTSFSTWRSVAYGNNNLMTL